MNLFTILPEYRDYLVDVEDLAHSTVKGKMQEARLLCEHLESIEITESTEITADAVSSYVVGSYGHLADYVFNIYIGHLKRFLRYLREEGLLGEDAAPERKLKPRRRAKARRVRQWLFHHELEEKATKGAEYHEMIYYLIHALFYMARRANELNEIRVGQVDRTPRPGFPFGLFQFSDNKKDSELEPMPIQEGLAPKLDEWLHIYEALLGRPLRSTDYLFPAIDTNNGDAIRGVKRPRILVPGRKMPYGTMWKRLSEAGIQGAHAARRGGLHYVDETIGLDAAQTLANHTTPAMTARYLNKHKKREQLGDMFAKRAAEAAEPVAQPVPEVPQDMLAARRARRSQAG